MLIEAEAVAEVGFCLVGNLEAAEVLRFETLAGEEVEDVLDVLDAVDVAVDVNVAVVGVDGAQELRLAETETGMALDGTEGPLPCSPEGEGLIVSRSIIAQTLRA